MSKTLQNILGTVGLLAFSVAWYCGGCIAGYASGGLGLVAGAAAVLASIGAGVAAFRLGGFFDGR